MNTTQKVSLVIIVLLVIGLCFSVYMYLTDTSPVLGQSAQTQAYSYNWTESGKYSRDYTNDSLTNCHYMGGTDSKGEVIWCDSPDVARHYHKHVYHIVRVTQTQDVPSNNHNGKDTPSVEVPVTVEVTTNEVPTIDPPAVDTPDQVTESHNDDNNDKSHDDKIGNPGNLKSVGNAGEKEDKGMCENCNGNGDGSNNGQHGNSDNTDKGNGNSNGKGKGNK